MSVKATLFIKPIDLIVTVFQVRLWHNTEGGGKTGGLVCNGKKHKTK